MTCLRQALRAATHTAHNTLETAMALDAATLTKDRYGRALQVLHAIRTGWEPALAGFIDDTQGPHLGWLETDLRMLQLQLLPPAQPPRLTCTAEAWGTLYVLEGSALGGRSMLRDLTRLGLTPEYGARYFAGRGDQTGAHWLVFLARLEAQDAQNTTPLIVEAAKAAFANLTSAARHHLTTL